MASSELEFTDSPKPVKRSLKLTLESFPKSIYNSLNSKSTVSNSQLSLPESISTPSKIQQAYRQDLLDTAVFDSPHKKPHTSRADSCLNSLPEPNDFSYREILKSYNVFHKKAISDSFSSQLSHLKIKDSIQRPCKKSINKVNSFKPKLISSLCDSKDFGMKETSLKLSNTLTGHRNALTGICVYDDKLWTVGLDYKLICWDPHKKYKKISRTAHSRGIIGICIYKSSLVTASKDGTLKFWSNTGCQSHKAHKGSIKSITSVSDFILTGSETIKVWAGRSFIYEYPSCLSYSLTSFKDHTFLSGCDKSLKLFDIRIKNYISEFEAIGPFTSCIKWDDHSFWSGSECELIKWDLRTCGTLQKMKSGKINALCKAHNSLITVSESIGIFDNPQVTGPFSSAFYDEKADVLYSGRRTGELNVVDFV